MKSDSYRLLRNAIFRRSGHGFSKRRAESRTEQIFLAGKNKCADDPTSLIGLNAFTEMDMLLSKTFALFKRII